MTDRDGAAEVIDAVAAARRSGGRLRVRGGGTSAVPPSGGASWLDVGAHRGVLDLRPVDGVVEARAGTPLAELSAALRAAGRRLVVRAWDPGTGTVGGAVAAAADGVAARGGARWRDHVLGVRAVLGTGDVVFVGARVVKSVAGFDVPKALVGSRGTLAALLDVVLRVEPIPEGVAALATAPVAPPEIEDAVARVDACGVAPAGLVATPVHGSGQVVVDVLLEGAAGAVARAAARLRETGFRPADDAEGRWRDLARDAGTPPPPGHVRRVVRGSRIAPPIPMEDGPERPWTADLLRRTVTWIAPQGPRVEESGEGAVGALSERVRRCFDPDGLFQPGRGFGAP